jgi:NADH:ubiquinone oxidoreductase subunit E
MTATKTKKKEPRNLERDRTQRALAGFSPGSEFTRLALAVQESIGYVPEHVVPQIAQHAQVTLEQALSAIEEDAQLLQQPPGRHQVTICTGKTCAGAGGANLVRTARKLLGIEVFRATPDGAIRLEPFKCIGKCAMAPNIRIDGNARGAMNEKRFKLLLAMLMKPTN